jgi:hypothetical protein
MNKRQYGEATAPQPVNDCHFCVPAKAEVAITFVQGPVAEVLRCKENFVTSFWKRPSCNNWKEVTLKESASPTPVMPSNAQV